MEEAKHPVKSVETALAVVDALKTLGPATVQEVADELDMYKSTVHNHLSTLREQEYVVQQGEEYALSLEFLHVGGVLRTEIELYEVAKPHVETLAAETDQLATVATHERGMATILYRAKGEEAVDIDTHVGSQLSLHNSALGKAILAQLPPERIEDILAERGLPRTTPNTITDPATLRDELEWIREEGYALDDEENWRGLRCVAAPILTEAGDVEGSISIAAPKNRLATEADRAAYVQEVKNAANLVELSISYA